MADPNQFPGNRTVTVGGNESITIGGSRTETVGNDETITVGKNHTVSAGKKVLVVAADEFELRVGNASLLMRKDGSIVLKGRDISIEGFGAVRVKSSGNIVIKGSKIQEN